MPLMAAEHNAPFRLRPMPIVVLRDLQDGESDVPFVRWVQVLKLGTQFTNQYKTPFVLDDEGAAHVVAVFKDLTTRDDPHEFIFDLNHYSVDGGPTPEHEGRTGTMLALEHRIGEGVWALTKFTEDAEALIRSEKFQLASPELWPRVRDPDTGAWIDGPVLAAAALVERPALAGMERIVASDMLLGDRFGLSDVDDVVSMLATKVDELAETGMLGESELTDGHQWDVHLVTVSPTFDEMVVFNRREGQHFAIDIMDTSTQGAVLTNIRPVRREFVPDTSTSRQEDRLMADENTTEQTIADLEAKLAELTESNAGLVALKEAAGDLTPEQIVTLREAPPAGDESTMQMLRDSINDMAADNATKDAQIATSETERTLLSDRIAVFEDASADRSAADLVEVYERQGKITPATRDAYRKMARLDGEGFKALAEAMPVVFTETPRGTGGAQNLEDAPDTLDTRIRKELKKRADAGNAATYADVLEEFKRDDEDAVLEHSNTLPEMHIVRS